MLGRVLMQALVVTCRDPFRPSHRRSVATVRRRRRIAALAPRTCQPVVCILNGQPLLRAGWRRKLRDGDTCAFMLLPQGGGGGGSNPMRIVLTVAMALIAPQLAVGILGPELAATAVIGSITMGQIVGGIIGFVGNMLINALIPAPKASSSAQLSASNGLAAPSPTYSVGAQGNQARIGQPIPSFYGRHVVYPDFGAAPYVEYAGNEQYLYQLFVIGQGEYEIESIRIEDTSISSFEEITYEIVEPGGLVTLFPTAVTTSVEVGGQEALTSTALGPFIANAAETEANALAIDGLSTIDTIYVSLGSVGFLDASSWTFSNWSASSQINLTGSGGDDTIYGSSQSDVISGGDGADLISEDGGGGT